MKQKLLSILALLLMTATGAWAQGSGGGDDWGPVQTSTPESTNPGGTYTITYYAPYGISPSKDSEDYTFGSDTKITLPSISDGGYKWMLSKYGRAFGETTSHCAGPNGDIYDPGTEVNLSNIYGDIEFCPVYIGCQIDCRSQTESTLTSFSPNKYAVVNLKNRTLYKDGSWNTLTLPFNLSKEKLATTCLAGADIRTFKSASWDKGNKQLTINFSSSNDEEIKAGVPCIIRWGEPGNAPGGTIENPLFTNVSVDLWTQDVLEGPNKYETVSNGLCFNAQIGPVQLTSTTRALVLGADNKLYKPDKQIWVYASRGYFTYTKKSGISMTRGIKIGFGDK